MRLLISIKDKGAKDFVQVEIARITSMSEQDTKRFADYTAQRIRFHIENAVSSNPFGKSTGNLASLFFSEPISNGWGVGDIPTLNRQSPGWRHINYGSEAIGANWQHWLPKGRWVDNRWVADPDGFWFMPSKPIAPRNYIEKTLADVRANERQLLSGKL